MWGGAGGGRGLPKAVFVAYVWTGCVFDCVHPFYSVFCRFEACWKLGLYLDE